MTRTEADWRLEELPDLPEIIVITGSGRSGSQYLSGLLKRHFDINFSAEPKFIIPLSRRMGRFGDLRNQENLRSLAEWIHDHSHPFRHLHDVVGIPSTTDELVERVRHPSYTGVLYAVFQLLAEKRGHTLLGYRDPGDLTRLPQLGRLLPTAKFVHIVRDGRDVAASYANFDWGPTNLYVGARTWATAVSRASDDGARLGDARYLEVRHEDLLQAPERESQRLGAFVGGITEKQAQRLVQEVLETRRLDVLHAWSRSMSPGGRHACEAAAGPTLRRFGYPTEFDGARLSLLRQAAYLTADGAIRGRNRLSRELRGKTKSRGGLVLRRRAQRP